MSDARAKGGGANAPSLFAVVSLAMISHTAFSASRMTVSLAAIAMKAPTLVVGVLLSLYALLPMLLSVRIGRWIDRVGTRAPMLVGALLLGLAFVLPALWMSLAALALNALVAGLGFLLFHMSVQKLTGEIGDGAERMRNFGLLAVGFSVSGFVGPISAGYLIDHAGHGVSFGAAFALSTLLVAGAFALLKWRWRFDGRTLIDPGSRPLNAGVLDLLREPEMRRLYVAVLLISSAWDVFMFLVPVQGSRVGLSASQIGMVLGAFSAATFVVRVAMPLFASRVTEWQLIGTVQAVACAVYLAFPLVTSHYGLVALSFLLGLGLGVGQPAVMALLHRVTPAGRVGEAVGLRMAMINGTQAVLPAAFGGVGSALAALLTGSLAFAPMFWGAALLLGAGGWSALRARGD